MRRCIALVLFIAPQVVCAQMITPNPCQLLTANEVLSATHDTVTKTSLSQYQAPVCEITTTNADATIKIKIEPTRDYDDAFWDEIGPDKKVIPSLGERAVVTGTPPVTKVLRRGHVYTISYENITLQPDAIREREKALAFFAITRAP
jgi:hypothetical protein